MSVIVFGANGRVGRRVVRMLAHTDGSQVTAFVRDPEVFERALRAHDTALTRSVPVIITGDVLDPGAVLAAMEGHDAVVSCLGVRGFSAAGAAEAGGFTRAMRNIIGAAEETGVRRFITVAVSGILPDIDSPGHLIRDRADYAQVFAPASAAHLEVHGMLSESRLEWTVVCPGRMPEGEASGGYTALSEARPEGAAPQADGASGISTGDVADLIVKELIDPSFVRRRVGIASGASA